jgi:tetratricopeptide (TPR) repeat protein
VGAASAALILASGMVAWSLIPAWHDDLTLFASIARADPLNAQAHANYAMLLGQEGRFKEADAQVALALSLDPRRPEPYFTRALIHYARGEWSGVVADCDTSIALDPRRMEPHVTRARGLLRLGRYDEARAELEPLIKRLPGNPFVESAWGQYLVGRGDFAAALPYLERATAMIREDPDLDYAHGLASARLGRTAEARGAFQRAVDADSTLYDGWLRLAVACHLMGDAAARDRALERAAALPQAADGRAEAARRNFAAAPAASPRP